MPPMLLCHPAITMSPKGSLLSVLPLFRVRAHTHDVGVPPLKQATRQHKPRLTISSEVIGEDETAEWCGSSAFSLIACWDRCLRVSVPVHFRRSRSLVKPSWRLGARVWSSAARARTDDFRVKGSEASHLRVHTRPLINCFTCSYSQLSQPPDSVMILLSSAFVSCCGCSCVINPPFLSSAAEISYQVVTRLRRSALSFTEKSFAARKACRSIAGTEKRLLLTLLLCRELEFGM